MAIGFNSDVVRCMQQVYEECKDQPAEIGLTSYLKNSGLDIDGKCQSIFAYLVDNTNYVLDKDGEQFIRYPGRILEEGRGDCKSLTMFICCCLHCLGISHKMRFVSFDNQKIYTHVYAVALDEQGCEIILDACELDSDGQPKYDYARPYTYKKDITYYE